MDGCEHEWEEVATQLTDMEMRRCVKCGMRQVRVLPPWKAIDRRGDEE